MRSSIQQKMFKRISRWQRSGLGQKAWCEKNKMAYATFHYWYKSYRLQMPAGVLDNQGDFMKLMAEVYRTQNKHQSNGDAESKSKRSFLSA